MAALPPDFFNQLDELQSQEQKAREAFAKEYEESERLRGLAADAERILANAKYEEVEAALACAKSEHQAAVERRACDSLEQEILEALDKVNLLQERRRALQIEMDEETEMMRALAHQVQQSRQEVETYFMSKPKWETHQRCVAEEQKLLTSVGASNEKQLEEMLIRMEADLAAVKKACAETSTELDQNDKELPELEQEAAAVQEATNVANRLVADELAAQEANVEALLKAKKAIEDDIQHKKSQTEVLIKSLEQRKQFLIARKKQLMETMRAAPRK